jgi:hypothetical protein
MLMPIGGISVMVLVIAGILVGLELRKRQQQRRQTVTEMIAQSQASQTPWMSQQMAEDIFNRSNPGLPILNFNMGAENMDMGGGFPAMDEQDFMQQQQPFPMMGEQDFMQQQAFPAMDEQDFMQRQPFPSMQQAGPTMQYGTPTQTGPTMQYGASLQPSQSMNAVPATPQQPFPSQSGDMAPLNMDLPPEVSARMQQLSNAKNPPSLAGLESLQDDPFLEAMMKQAQMGLFAAPDKDQ